MTTLLERRCVPENRNYVAVRAKELDALEAERDRLRAERKGEIDANRGHEYWEMASREELLDALRFQGATTKALIVELDRLRAEVAALKTHRIVYSPDAKALSDRCENAEAERDRLRELLFLLRVKAQSVCQRFNDGDDMQTSIDDLENTLDRR